jgi:outer membrane protein assembly factor BamB
VAIGTMPRMLITTLLLSLATPLTAQNWPSFRGPGGSGVGTGSPPIRWNVETGENLKWKVRIPGFGHSSPVVWGDRIFVTTAVSNAGPAPELKTGWLGGSVDSATDQGDWTWKVLCLDKANGAILWEKDGCTGVPKIKRHPKSSHANSTPATDGRHVVAFFGSEGLYCYDTRGQLLWKNDLGVLKAAYYEAPEAEWGFGSSPIIYQNKVIVQCDVLDGAFWASFDVETGRELRRVSRADVPTWCTPAICESGGRTQLICNGWKHMGAYDLETGEELWTLSGGGDIPVPTPQVAHGLIFLTSGHGRSPIYAIRADARGDLTPQDDEKLPEGLAWWKSRMGSYMPTPLVLDDSLYVANDIGVLTVFDGRTGAQRYRARIKEGGNFSASIVAADGRLYFLNEDGDTFVLKAGDTYELLAQNSVDEPCLATPAISDGLLLIRGRNHLFCLGR